MFINVTEQVEQCVEGFSYVNQDGEQEFVHVGPHVGDGVDIEDSITRKVTIYREDIPQLIKALQAAYDHISK